MASGGEEKPVEQCTEEELKERIEVSVDKLTLFNFVHVY